MDSIAALLHFEMVEAFAATGWGMVLIPFLLALLTASMVALSVPGTIMPLSFTGGLLMGPAGIFVVAVGALLGSHVLFLVSRHTLSDWMRRKLGHRLDGFQEHLGRRGPVYVVGARLTGVPHLLVTAGSAMTPMSARAFGGASLLGMLPAITVASMAGWAI